MKSVGLSNTTKYKYDAVKYFLFISLIAFIEVSSNEWIQQGQTIVGESAEDFSGNKVSISSDGKIVAIGALANDGNGDNSGQVRVYSLNDSIWIQMGNDIDGEYEGDYSGSAICLSDDGKTLIIGASNSRAKEFDSLGNKVPYDFKAGQVKIFRFDNNDWIQLGEDIDGTSYYNLLGSSVAISGDGYTVAIGARGNEDTMNNEGCVQIYRFEDGDWNRIGFLLGEEPRDYFGNAVSLNLNGSRLAVGGYWNNGNGKRSGHVRVFEYIDTVWNQIGDDIDGEAEGDEFGYSIDLSSKGDTFIAGAFRNDENGDLAGHARIFELVSGKWVKKGNDLNGDFQGDELGWCVSIDSSGNTVAIGAPESGFNKSLIGQAKIFEYKNNDWVQLGESIEGLEFADNFGRDIDLSADGSIVAIGSSENDDNGNNSGHVRVFKFDKTTSIKKKENRKIILTANSSKSSINIQINDNLIDTRLELYDMKGRIIKRKNIENTNPSISLSDLIKGTYFLIISNRSIETLMTKIIKLDNELLLSE